MAGEDGAEECVGDSCLFVCRRRPLPLPILLFLLPPVLGVRLGTPRPHGVFRQIPG